MRSYFVQHSDLKFRAKICCSWSGTIKTKTLGDILAVRYPSRRKKPGEGERGNADDVGEIGIGIGIRRCRWRQDPWEARCVLLPSRKEHDVGRKGYNMQTAGGRGRKLPGTHTGRYIRAMRTGMPLTFSSKYIPFPPRTLINLTLTPPRDGV